MVVTFFVLLVAAQAVGVTGMRRHGQEARFSLATVGLLAGAVLTAGVWFDRLL